MATPAVVADDVAPPQEDSGTDTAGRVLTGFFAEALARYLELDPGVTISHIRRQLPYRNAEQAERLWEGLRKAGLPE